MAGLFDIAGKSALVTGGSRGIGLMIARGFVEAGATVYISSRKAEVCDEVAAELSKLGTCVSIPADLSLDGEAERLAAEVTEREPALNILVNNAGATWGAPLADFPADAWDKVMNLNTKAPFLLTRALVPALEAARYGRRSRARHQHRIDRRHPGPDPRDLRVLHEQGRDPSVDAPPRAQPRAAQHHGQRGRARTVRVEDDGRDAARLRRLDRALAARPHRPSRRHGGVAIYLASRAGAYVTGAVIPVDGGIARRSSYAHSSPFQYPMRLCRAGFPYQPARRHLPGVAREQAEAHPEIP